MSRRELDRASVLAQLVEDRVTQVYAAKLLGLSTRQVRRLSRAYAEDGPSSLASKRRGRRSNRAFPDEIRDAALTMVRTYYADFGPTFAHEKLTEQHGFSMSVTTLRDWMVEAEMWTPRHLRDRRVHQPRNRRPCRGELIQIDGCDHPWFEDRAPRCTLLVFVDDATSELMELRFAPSESTFEYFKGVRSYLSNHGRPVAFYSDKASIFRVNMPDHGGSGLTQFGRAMQDLNIDVICAHSAPAKGRVERAHQTLQDRLVKELRLADINTMGDANAFALQFIADYNQRFGRVPVSPHDAHRALPEDTALEDIFRLQLERTVTRNLTLHFRGLLYVLEPTPEAHAIKGQRVRVYEDDDGNISIRSGDVELAAKAFAKRPRAGVTPGAIVANKHLGEVLTRIRAKQLKRDEEELAKAKTKRARRLINKRLRAAGAE